MKRTMIGTFVLGVLASATPAMAQDSETFTVQTEVPAYCSQFTVGPAPMNLGGLTGTSGQILPAFASGSETERQLATNLYCNAPSTVSIKAEPLMHDTITVVTDSTSFTNRVDYTATVKWNTIEGSSSSSSANPVVLSATQPTIGALTLKVASPAVTNNLRPVAGNYAGQVRLTIALAQ
ncbi:MAG: hypothetical protein EOP58_07820 [Sphingomonadales bacterium]|nr:MAG: hypothetical protein EOP58_07820 [Sphingomonadales bacterium]